MTSLIQYVSRILIISLPAVIVFLCFMPYRMRALKAMNLHSGWQREIGLILFVVSIFGILAQYFIMRNTAVDDIILNTLGAICGYWVYRLLRKMFPGFSRKFICNITQAAGN